MSSLSWHNEAEPLTDPLRGSRQELPPFRAIRKQTSPGRIHRLPLFRRRLRASACILPMSHDPNAVAMFDPIVPTVAAHNPTNRTW